MQNYLRIGAPRYNTQKSYTYIHVDQKMPKFGIFSSPIVQFSYAAPLQHPNHTLFKLLKGLKSCILPHQIQISYTKGRCLVPLSRALPLDPNRSNIGRFGPHSWVRALRAQCFSSKQFPKSWKPWFSSFCKFINF